MEQSIGDRIKKLSVSERILLAEDIWDSIAEENKTFELTSAQKEELDKRLEALKQNPNTGRSWEEIRSEFTGK